MANLQEAIDNLKEQQKQVEAQLHQILGAVSVLTGLVEEDEKKSSKGNGELKKQSKKSTDSKQPVAG